MCIRATGPFGPLLATFMPPATESPLPILSTSMLGEHPAKGKRSTCKPQPRGFGSQE